MHGGLPSVVELVSYFDVSIRTNSPYRCCSSYWRASHLIPCQPSLLHISFRMPDEVVHSQASPQVSLEFSSHSFHTCRLNTVPRLVIIGSRLGLSRNKTFIAGTSQPKPLCQLKLPIPFEVTPLISFLPPSRSPKVISLEVLPLRAAS